MATVFNKKKEREKKKKYIYIPNAKKLACYHLEKLADY